MYEDLHILQYPDPRLRKSSKPVGQFTADLKKLAARMFELMREHKGVGLAAAQVGQNIRLFVMNATGKPEDDRVYVNPVLSELEDPETDEEGCLSIPELRVNVVRSVKIHMAAQDLDGKPFEQSETGLAARIWQHETDHLNGTLIIDRMGLAARLGNRKLLKDLEATWAKEHPQPIEKKKPRRTRPRK